MDVLVGIDVRWIPSHQPSESRKLPGRLIFNGFDIIHRNYFIHWHPSLIAVAPLAEINVDTEAEFWVLSAVCGSVNSGGPAHHQACAGYDTMFMRLEDAPVHARALAEIVCVDYQIFFRSHSLTPPMADHLLRTPHNSWTMITYSCS